MTGHNGGLLAAIAGLCLTLVAWIGRQFHVRLGKKLDRATFEEHARGMEKRIDDMDKRNDVAHNAILSEVKQVRSSMTDFFKELALGKCRPEKKP